MATVLQQTRQRGHIGTWSIPSTPGNECLAMHSIHRAIPTLGLPPKRLAALKTAVAVATMNAMEHGNHYEAAKLLSIEVFASRTALVVRLTDQGGSQTFPASLAIPDLEAGLTERQSPREWGLGVIKNLVDEMRVAGSETHHTLELIMYLEGANHVCTGS